MLVIRRVELRCDHGAVGRLHAGRQRTEREDAGQLDLKLDVAVLIEVPEKAILVVFHGRDGGDDQPARAADFRGVQPAVGVFPQDSVVLLVHADGVLDGERIAPAGAEVAVKILDVAQTIAAEFQTVRAIAETVFTGIEGVLARLLRSGIAVGNDHLGERTAVEHRAHPAAVGVGERVEREAFPGIEPNDEVPFLPAHAIALHREARSFGLHDFKRFRGGAKICDAIGRVVGLLRWQRPVPVLLDAEHLHGVEIDDGAQALDRLGVAVVGRVGAEETKGTRQPTGAVLLGTIITGAPDIDHHELGVFDAVLPFQRGLELGAGEHGLFTFDLLVDRHGRLHAGDVLPREHRAVR